MSPLKKKNRTTQKIKKAKKKDSVKGSINVREEQGRRRFHTGPTAGHVDVDNERAQRRWEPKRKQKQPKIINPNWNSSAATGIAITRSAGRPNVARGGLGLRMKIYKKKLGKTR